MLTNEQVGSIYSKILVFSAIFCLAATTLPLFGFEPGILIYIVGTALTLLTTFALFPLGQRLFNFFDLNLLVRSEILPTIFRCIKSAAKPGISVSLANHHSRAAQRAIAQLAYIDERINMGKEALKDNLPLLTDNYTALLLHYLQQRHAIDQNSYWFPRKVIHKQWFLAGDSETSRALEMSNQQMLVESKADQQWLENEIIERLAGHVELAFAAGDLKLALKLIARFSTRLTAYAQQFQFFVGMKEVIRFKEIIEQGFASSNFSSDINATKTKIAIADTWSTLGSNLCLETLRRMITFEKELQIFFDADDWSEKSLRSLPPVIQLELAFIVTRIIFEHKIEGRRLSKPKYIQQLAIQKLLQHYAKVLPQICEFYLKINPNFIDSLIKSKMPEAATQVVLSSLHCHWKLPRWFCELNDLTDRYHQYEHYSEEQYKLPVIDFSDITNRFNLARNNALAILGNETVVGYIFDSTVSDDLPDHFGQIYYELAEACVNALEKNDANTLNKLIPMFISLTLAAKEKFRDTSLEVSNEYRLHLISTAINDLASVLGFCILYSAYFDNPELAKNALDKFREWLQQIEDKQKYLIHMLTLFDPFSFSMSASPRSLIRTNWRMSFEHRARVDGFSDHMIAARGKAHPNKIVREFLKSHSDASHLFFAIEILPQLQSSELEVNNEITDLARRLNQG
ncbi:hypothetical protein M1D96_05420 [Pseudomonas sp. D1-3]